MTAPHDATGRGRAWLGAAAWLPALVWMAVIFRFSSIPGSNVPGNYSTLAHFIEYAMLAALLFLPASRLREGASRAASIAVVVASFYAMTDEIHQAFVPGRVPDVADWAVDTTGAAVAVVILAFVLGKKKAAREGRPS